MILCLLLHCPYTPCTVRRVLINKGKMEILLQGGRGQPQLVTGPSPNTWAGQIFQQPFKAFFIQDWVYLLDFFLQKIQPIYDIGGGLMAGCSPPEIRRASFFVFSPKFSKWVFQSWLRLLSWLWHSCFGIASRFSTPRWASMEDVKKNPNKQASGNNIKWSSKKYLPLM